MAYENLAANIVRRAGWKVEECLRASNPGIDIRARLGRRHIYMTAHIYIERINGC